MHKYASTLQVNRDKTIFHLYYIQSDPPVATVAGMKKIAGPKSVESRNDYGRHHVSLSRLGRLGPEANVDPFRSCHVVRMDG